MGGRRPLTDLSDDELSSLLDPPRARSVADLSDEELEAQLAGPSTPVQSGGAGARLLEQLSGNEEERAAREASLQAEHGGALSQAMAGSEALSRGLTLGGSSVASAALTGALTPDGPQLTPEARERMKDPAVAARMAAMGVRPQDVPADRGGFSIGYDAARQQEDDRAAANPVTALGGEIGGALLPALVTGGASAAAEGSSLLARGGQAALRYSPAGLAERAAGNVATRLAGPGAGLVGRVGGNVLGHAGVGGLETLAYEASQLREADIANPEEAAEHLLYAWGTGALLSGVAGGVFGGSPGATRRAGQQTDELGTTLAQQGAGDELVQQAGRRADSHIGALDQLSQQAKQVPANDVATRNAIDHEGGLLLDEATQEIERRPLSAAQIPEPPRAKWRAVAERAQAAGGKFKEAVDTGTRAARQDFDNVLRGMDQIDEYGGIAAKQRANQFNVGHAVDSTPVDNLLADMHGEIAGFMQGRSRTALASGGGLNALEGVKKVINESGALIRGALGRGDVGEAYNLLDQGVKGFLGKARGSARAEPVKDLIERMYPKIQGFLEDESSWGELAQRQKLANPSWSNRIGVSMDGRIQGLTTIAGERKANLFDNIKLANSSGLESLFNRLGDAGTEDVEQAFRTHLRAMARDATDRTRAWGTDKLRDEATRVVGSVKRIEDTMDRIALLRRDKLAHEASLQGSTIQMVGQLASSLGASGIGAGISAAVGAKRKLVEMLGAAQSPGERAAIQASIPPPLPLEQTVGQVTRTTGSRIAQAGASMLQTVGRGAQSASAAAPFVQGAMLSDERHEQVMRDAVALNNPDSPEARQLYEQAAAIEKESPKLADAFAMSKLRMADYIASKMPKQDSQALYAPAPQLDPVTNRKLKRTVAAAVDPVGAIERMAAMRASPEDVETVRTLFPSMHKAYQLNAQRALKAAKVKPNYETRVAASQSIGVPADPSMEIDNLRMQQMVANAPDQAKLEENKAKQKNMAEAAKMGPGAGGKFRNADDVYAPHADAIMSRR
jgi:hypothetical protein